MRFLILLKKEKQQWHSRYDIYEIIKTWEEF